MDRWNKTHCDKCGERVEKGEGIYAIGGYYHNSTCYEQVKQEYIDNYEWNKLETSYTNEMICPYCGYENRDSFEYDDEEGDRECERCEREFEYSRAIEITYSTGLKAD